jgi:hypothetical protein
MQRFGRVETNHWFHAGFTVLTLGLWGISWLAIFIGRKVWPWRCKQCNWNDPDFTKRSRRRSTGDAEGSGGAASEVRPPNVDAKLPSTA